MRRALVTVVFFALAACSSAAKDSTLPNNVLLDPNTPVENPKTNEPNVAPGEIPAGCNFRVKGECYAEQTAACAAAGCADSCLVLESHPAQISCK